MPNNTISKEQAKGLSLIYSGILSNLNSATSASIAATLGGPFLAAYEAMKADCNAWIKKLEPTDAAGAALEFDAMLSSMCSAMSNAQTQMAHLWDQLQLARAKNPMDAAQVQAQLASAVAVEVEKLVAAGDVIPKAALDARIAAGDLVLKEMHTETCSQVKLAGIEEGEKRVRDEYVAKDATARLVGERRVLVQTAGLPIPAADLEAILGAPAETFTAAQTEAAKRSAFLKENRISLNSAFHHKIWGAADQWALVEASVATIVSERGSPHDPFAAGGGGTENIGKRPVASI